MDASQSFERHIRSHHEHSRGWAFICLNISALVILASVILGAFIDSWPSKLLFQITGALIILSSFYLLTCDLLYRRLRDRFIDEHEATADEADASNREVQLETLGRLAGGVAHDFNNSLMVLLNCIEMLGQADDSMTRQKLLTDMESAARGAQSTAAQLMSLSQDGSAPGQPSHPRAALRSVASNLRRMFPENIIVQDQLRGTPPVTLVSGQFEQVILNICLNSKDAMPDGGTVTLRCYEEPVAGEVIIEIEDSVDSSRVESRAQLESTEGYPSIRDCGGRLSARVLSGQGTRITLALPVAEGVEESDTSLQEVLEVDELRALLVDDNELVLATLSTRLQEAGYQVSTALSVAEACRLASENTFDALICDAVLTDGTPRPVLEQFREKSRGPIVVCSGYPKDDPLLAELDIDDALFLQKPFSTDELLQQLSRKQQQQAA